MSLCAGDRRRQANGSRWEGCGGCAVFWLEVSMALGGCVQDKKSYFGLKKWSRGYQKACADALAGVLPVHPRPSQWWGHILKGHIGLWLSSFSDQLGSKLLSQCSSTGKRFMEVTQPSTNRPVPILTEERQPPNDKYGQAIAFRAVCYCCVCSAPSWHWFPGHLQQPRVPSGLYTSTAEHRWDCFTPGT